MAETTAVFKISVDSAQAVQAIAEYSRKIEELKNEEKALREEIKQSGTQTNEQAKTLVRLAEQRKAYTRALQESSKQVQNDITQSKEEEGSLKSLRAELSNLTKKYDEMGRARRESQEGRDLQKQINEVTYQLQDAEEGTQRFYRNVGNYENSLSSLFDTTAANAGQTVVNIKNVIVASGGVIPAFKAMGAAATTAFGPIGIIVMAVVAVFKLLKDAVNSSEESSNEAGEAFSFITVIMDNVKKVLQVVVSWIMKVVNVIVAFHQKTMEIMSKVLRWIGLGKVSDFMDEMAEKQRKYNEAIKEQNRLVKEARKLTEKSADAELEIAKLREKATDKINYSAKQRLALLKEANEKERKLAEEKYNLARREYENVKTLNDLTSSTAEDNEKVSQAYVKMRQEELAYYNKKKELNAQMAEATNQIIADAKKIAEEQKAIREAELEDIEAAIDATLELYADGQTKELLQLETTYRRKKEMLEKRLREDKTLTVKQTAAINQQILALTEKLEQDKTALNKKYAEERAEQEKALAERIQDAELEIMSEGEDKELAAASLKYDRKMDSLYVDYLRDKQTLETEIANLEKTNGEGDNEEAIAEIYERIKKLGETYDELISLESEIYARELATISSKYSKKDASEAIKAEQEAWREKIALAKLNGENYLAIQLEQKRKEIDALNNLDEAGINTQFDSYAEFLEHKLKLTEEYAKLEAEAKAEAIKGTMRDVESWNAIGSAISSVSGIVENFADESRAAAIASKALALGEIAVQTGIAIAKGVAAAAAAGPPPANLAAILTTVATVLGNIASATSIVKSAKFATGGYVSGPGTGTSDSIPARLSNGESVLNARATSMFAPILSPLNQMGGGIPIVASQSAAQVQGEEMLARAFAKGLKDIDIRVGVDEISRVQNRVKVIERMGTL